jgi:hypothetical protein
MTTHDDDGHALVSICTTMIYLSSVKFLFYGRLPEISSTNLGAITVALD